MSREQVLIKLTSHTENLRHAYKRGGQPALQREIEKCIENLPGWERIPLRVGVIGRSGTGKSSFLNAIRKLPSSGSDAARVGVTETTQRAQEFTHPKNRKLILCDLPGAGTADFPLDRYIADRRIKFRSLDMIIVIFCSRFTESEVHLLLSAFSYGMQCLFIRTKVSLDIENQRKAKKRHFATDPLAAKRVVDEIRKDCDKNLESLPKKVGVYLMDNFDHDNELLDYAVLSEHLTSGFLDLKKTAFVEMAVHDVMRQIKETRPHTRHQARVEQEEGCHIL